MLKIKDNVDLQELETYDFVKWNDEGASVDYYRKQGRAFVKILKDRTIHLQLPIEFDTTNSEYINFEDFIQDLIDEGLVEKVKEELNEDTPKMPERLYHCCMETTDTEHKVIISNINSLSDKLNEIIDCLGSVK